VVIVGSAFIVALILVSVALWYLKRGSPPTPHVAASPQPTSEKKDKEKKDKKAVSDATRWNGGDGRESSGAAWVPDTNQVLFVDDKDSANILCVTIDDEANQSGDLISVPLGVKVDDAEDITF